MTLLRIIVAVLPAFPVWRNKNTLAGNEIFLSKERTLEDMKRRPPEGERPVNRGGTALIPSKPIGGGGYYQLCYCLKRRNIKQGGNSKIHLSSLVSLKKSEKTNFFQDAKTAVDVASEN
jgi:hypothetical protein